MMLHDMIEGHRFVCQRCGNCCRWRGEVPVSDEEVDRIAHHLGIPVPEFIDEYTILRRNRIGLTLIEKPDGACVFLEGRNTCRIQAVKPEQCAGFPNKWNFPGWRKQCEAIPVPL